MLKTTPRHYTRELSTKVHLLQGLPSVRCGPHWTRHGTTGVIYDCFKRLFKIYHVHTRICNWTFTLVRENSGTRERISALTSLWQRAHCYTYIIAYSRQLTTAWYLMTTSPRSPAFSSPRNSSHPASCKFMYESTAAKVPRYSMPHLSLTRTGFPVSS